MRSRVISAALLLAKTASAVQVLVSAYAGNVTTFNLTTTVSDYTTQATLQLLDVSNACGMYASWLVMSHNNTLYCVDENWQNATHGGLSSLRVGPEGRLTLLNSVTTAGGPVSIALFGPGAKGLVTANYGNGSIDAFNVTDPSNILQTNPGTPFPALLKPSEDEIKNEPKRKVQVQARPHQAVVDPTGNYLFVPDLGNDMVRIFSIDNSTLGYKEIPGLVIRETLSASNKNDKRPMGARHIAFAKGMSKTFLYVLNELSNTVIGYDVNYTGKDSFSFSLVHFSNTHGEASDLNSTVAAAEIQISPDQRFLTLSSRFDGNLTVPNYDPNNSTALRSDPLITFTINRETGKLSHLQTRASGGEIPRCFCINKNGTLVGVALQGDSRIVIIKRDPESGLLGDIISSAKVMGMPNCIIFNE